MSKTYKYVQEHLSWVKEQPVLPILTKKVKKNMTTLVDKFKDIADLDGSGIVDTNDFKLFGKYVSAIYSTIVALCFVIWGDDFSIKENIYLMIIFLIVAIIIAIFLVYLSKTKSESAKKIASLTTKGIAYLNEIDSLSKKIESLTQKNEMDTILKDFMLQVKDGIANDLYDKIYSIYELFIKKDIVTES